MKSNSNPVLQGFRESFTPEPAENVWQWCENHVEVDQSSPFQGKWRSDRSPWVRRPMLDMVSPTVSQVAMMVSAQSAKTQTMQCVCCYAVARETAPAMWVAADDDLAGEFVRDRMSPTFNKCKPVKARMTLEHTHEFIFSGRPFYFRGAHSKSGLQSVPIRWLFLDEVRNYPPGSFEMVKKRTRAHSHNCRTIIISTPGRERDAIHRSFLEGDQNRWHWQCELCGEFSPLLFDCLRWETSEQTKPVGVWNFDAMADTIRLVCQRCGAAHSDKPDTRRRLAHSGKFVPANPSAPKSKRSYHWNALLPPWVSWRSIVEEFISAREQLKAVGDIQPLYDFVTETLGEPWKEELGAVEDFGFLEARKTRYEFGDAWPDEVCRAISADRQESGGEHYFFVARAFGKAGRSRLLGYGRANSKAELDEARERYKVPRSNALIDSGDMASEVYRFCMSYGWRPFKGDDAEFFLTQQPDPRNPERKIMVRAAFELKHVDPLLGKAGASRALLGLFRWSNPTVKDTLLGYMLGKVGEWTIPEFTGRDYMRQITAERREEVSLPSGKRVFKWKRVRKDNHYFDCELQLMVFALATGLSFALPNTSARK